jgi:hypothetical protein
MTFSRPPTVLPKFQLWHIKMMATLGSLRLRALCTQTSFILWKGKYNIMDRHEQDTVQAFF